MDCQCIRTCTILLLIVIQQSSRSNSFNDSQYIRYLLHLISRDKHGTATIAAPRSSMAHPSLCFASFRSNPDCHVDRQDRRPEPSSRFADPCASFMVPGSSQRRRGCGLAYEDRSLYLQHFPWRGYPNRHGMGPGPSDRWRTQPRRATRSTTAYRLWCC